MQINVKDLSITELRQLSKKCLSLADDLDKIKPSYQLAIEAGVQDNSYNTVVNGYIGSYSGEAVVTMADGNKWLCTGRRSSGDAYYAKDGFIEFKLIQKAP